MQVVNGGRSTEDVGMVTVNLAEFAGDRSTTRRYLLQEAGVNSIVKVSGTLTRRQQLRRMLMNVRPS